MFYFVLMRDLEQKTEDRASEHHSSHCLVEVLRSDVTEPVVSGLLSEWGHREDSRLRWLWCPKHCVWFLHWIFLPCRPSHVNSFVQSYLYTDKAKNYSIQQLIKQKSVVSLPWIFLQGYIDKNRCIITFPLTNAMCLWRLFVLWDPTTNTDSMLEEKKN